MQKAYGTLVTVIDSIGWGEGVSLPLRCFRDNSQTFAVSNTKFGMLILHQFGINGANFVKIGLQFS